MIYKIIKKFNKSILVLLLMFLGLISCYDSGYEEFVPPTGNVNNIQPNTLFTTSTNPDNNLSMVFRSYSTDAASYLWDFGDGNSSTDANPDYTYAKGGLYTVKLTTTSSDNLVAVDSSDVAPIFVDFNTTSIDSEVTFENLTTGAVSLVWDFGDGDTVEWDLEDTEEDADFNPIHAYKTAETFNATLTATNYLGAEFSVTKNIEGLVLSTVPDFTFITRGFTAEFTDASILAVSYSWDFGDGNTSEEPNPTHIYAGEGTYEVILTTTNDAGVSKSISQFVPIGGIDPTFMATVQNGTADDWTKNTGDNADAWDMTPNSTIEDNTGAVIPSPYRAIWYNSELNDYIDATYGTNEQPGSSSDGTYVDGVKTRAVKLSNSSRRLYQVVAVEPGVEYTFTIDTRSEAEGINTEVFILNNEITTEVGLDMNPENDPSVDAYYNITNDFNSSKGSATENTFTTTTFRFKATANIAVIYVRALKAVDSSNEVFIDNIDIITPEASAGVEATFAAETQNGTADDWTKNTGDNADAWDMTPNSTIEDNSGATIDSPYRAIWYNSELNAYIDATYGTNEQPGSSSDGTYVNGVKTRAVKLSNSSRRLYQVVAVEPGVEYTFTIDTRSEAEGINTEVFILNNEITTEVGLDANAGDDPSVDAYYNITNDFNSSKGSASENTFTTTTFTFTASSNIVVIYVRALNAIDGSNEVFIDNIDIITPGF
ncbi:PKD domain-containing protein [Lutibacter sp. A80]|uniref:PKD domain-containing protein n=1 Tax=Lutibacter sp. A80 TaxID=2918453 RepID=UPI002739C42D|nr:PKD domain-containing protein [Lutibacter sp. A80]